VLNVIGATRPTDAAFYRAVQETVQSLASGVDVRLDSDWTTRPWSDEGRAFIIERPAPEEAADRADQVHA